MPAGRPTKYNEEILERARAYMVAAPVVPSVAGLARELSVSKQTLFNWGEQHPEFMDTLEEIKAEQESRLIANGLSGEFNSTITKLMLANHGYSDKVDQHHSGGIQGGGEWVVNVVRPDAKPEPE